MKILHINSDIVKNYNLLFIIKDLDKTTYKYNEKVTDNKATIKVPAKNEISDFAHKCPCYVLARNPNNSLSFAEVIFPNPKDITYQIDLSWKTISYDIEDTYEIKHNEIVKNIKYTPNFTDPYNMLEEFRVDSIELELNGQWIEWMPITGLKEGNHQYNVKLITKNGLEFKKTINIIVQKYDSIETVKPAPISFQYAFFAPLNAHHFKPTIPVLCFVSENIQIKEINFFYNNILIGSTDNGKGVVELDVADVPAYTPVGIKAEFKGINKNTNEIINITDTKTFLISDFMNLKLSHKYNDKEKVFIFKIDGTKESLNNINKILFNIHFSSTVTENILSVADYNVDLQTDVIFEEEIDPSNPEIKVDFKMASNYYITAYVYDKAGNIHTMKDSIKQIGSTSDKTYFVDDKISTIIRSDINENPTFDLYRIETNSITKVGTFLTEKLYDDLYTGSFTVKENDCVYVLKVGNIIKAYYVGDSRNIVVLRVNPNRELPPYLFRDENGKEISKGTVTNNEIEPSIGYIVLPLHDAGIVKIGKNTYKKIK